jgi:hypothetical protein
LTETFLHPTGPGTPGFDGNKNEKIDNKLTILYGQGNALTYVQSAAEFDGHGAGQKLLARYDGFSRHRNEAMRKLIAWLKHTSGTSITDLTDLFEKICGQIASSGTAPTEEEKLELFLDSISEPTYEYTKHHCKHLKLMGTLTYPVMANLYKLTCFEKYPHFHVKEHGTKSKTLTNNSLHSHSHGRGRGRGRERSHAKGKGESKTKGYKQGKGQSKGKGRRQSKERGHHNKGKGRGNTHHTDTAKKSQDKEKKPLTKFQGTCSSKNSKDPQSQKESYS